MSKLWKGTTLIGGVFVTLSLALMLFYMAGKSVVITEEHGTEEGKGTEGTEGSSRRRLEFEEDGAKQVHLRFGTLVQEKSVTLFHALERNEIIVLVEGSREDALLPKEIRADKKTVKGISVREVESGVEIVLETGKRCQYEALWKEDELQLTLTDMEEAYDYLVAVNPAHGGGNRGNAVNTLEEKEITLEVGKELERISREAVREGRGKIGVLLMRSLDREISGEARNSFLQSGLPDLVLELHVNADPANEKTFGTSVHYNSSIFPRYMTSVELAEIVERKLVTEISGKANGIFADEEGKYPLLQVSYVPAVSVEMGFLTNQPEAVLLGKEEYRRKIAEGLYQGLEEAAALLDNRKKK